MPRIVVVGASLAGLRAAEAARNAGWTGELMLIGDERHFPYDRPPLSKRLLLGRTAPDDVALPVARALDAEWRLGVAATGLDRERREVRLSTGEAIAYGRLLVATGARARPWPRPDQAALGGVHLLRTLDESVALRDALAAGPRRVLVVGGGFIACEIASVCRRLDVPVTMAAPGSAPLEGALGSGIGKLVASLHRSNGVALRMGAGVADLVAGDHGRVRAARLTDGDEIEADLVVLALGAVRNTEWLDGAGLSADENGLDCDDQGRALERSGAVAPDIFAAGDVARFPHPVYDGRRVALEHWGHAAAHGAHVGRVMASGASARPYDELPAFWSTQHGVTIKSVGLTGGADAVRIVRGDPKAGRFVAVHGRAGRCVAATSFDSARWMELYADMIRRQAPFPPPRGDVDEPAEGVAAEAAS